jgi:hypothetical protein
MARTYNKSEPGSRPAPVRYQPPTNIPAIDERTKTVGVAEASELLASERGLKLSPKTIRAYCSTGKWERGFHWVKPGRDYLINMAAVYAWLVQ